MKKKSNHYACWEYVEGLQQNNDENPIQSLNKSWGILTENIDEYKSNDRILDTNFAKNNLSTPLKAFLSFIEMGIYPPPEVLLSICDSFNHYLREKGAVKLEDCFYESKKGQSSYSRRHSSDYTYSKLLIEINENPDILQLEAAEKIKSDLSISTEPESIERGYRRWKKAHAIKDRIDIENMKIIPPSASPSFESLANNSHVELVSIIINEYYSPEDLTSALNYLNHSPEEFSTVFIKQLQLNENFVSTLEHLQYSAAEFISTIMKQDTQPDKT